MISLFYFGSAHSLLNIKEAYNPRDDYAANHLEQIIVSSLPLEENKE